MRSTILEATKITIHDIRIFFHVIFSWAHLANILAWRAKISRIFGWNFSCCWCTMGTIFLPKWLANWGGGPSLEGTLLGRGDIFCTGTPKGSKIFGTKIRSRGELAANWDCLGPSTRAFFLRRHALRSMMHFFPGTPSCECFWSRAMKLLKSLIRMNFHQKLSRCWEKFEFFSWYIFFSFTL